MLGMQTWVLHIWEQLFGYEWGSMLDFLFAENLRLKFY